MIDKLLTRSSQLTAILQHVRKVVCELASFWKKSTLITASRGTLGASRGSAGARPCATWQGVMQIAVYMAIMWNGYEDLELQGQKGNNNIGSRNSETRLQRVARDDHDLVAVFFVLGVAFSIVIRSELH